MPVSESWVVYIVQTESGKLYTGITKDLERRMAEHAGTSRGAKFFRTSPPDGLVYQEACSGRSEATRRELEIKRMSRAEKEDLVRSAQ